jgi:hypothetical protein
MRTLTLANQRLIGLSVVAVWLLLISATVQGEPQPSGFELVLVDPPAVTARSVEQWKAEGFKGVVVVLDERWSKANYETAANAIAGAGLELYYWIEVGRNATMAKAHPKWMAALGTHPDWLNNFPKAPEPGLGEVAKAYPWVPIGYREAFEAHLQRIADLMESARGPWRGLLLNDLQGGPSSCGCGNSLCRWALDYKVRSTATPMQDDGVAARFLAEVHRRAEGRLVIPVWTTECEMSDLPANKHHGQVGTGRCGTVGCATGTCPLVFTRQWSALASTNGAPVGLLALYESLQRTQSQFGGGPTWPSNAVAYVQETVPANGGKAVARERLWLIVEGADPAAEKATRQAAHATGAGAVVVARVKIEQGFEPRLLRAD